MQTQKPPIHASLEPLPATVENLYALAHSRASRLAFSLLRNPADADDAVAIAYTRLMPEMEKYTSVAQATGHLFKTVRHICIDMIRQRRRFEDMNEWEWQEITDKGELAYTPEAPESASAHAELTRWIIDACEPSQYNLVKAYLQCPDIPTLALERKVSETAITQAFRRLGKRLGAIRASARQDIKLMLRMRAEWSKGSRGGRSAHAVQLSNAVWMLVGLLGMDGELTEGTEAWGFKVALTPARPELPYQGMLAGYYGC